jgi:hypothetical protein
MTDNTVNTYTYAIDEETFSVSVKVNDAENPSFVQPCYPNRELFSSVEDATIWAELFIESLKDISAPLPPEGPGLQGRTRPNAEQRESIKEAYETLKAATTDEERQAAEELLQDIYSTL